MRDPSLPTCADLECWYGETCENDFLGGAQCLADSCDVLTCPFPQECAVTDSGLAYCIADDCDALNCPIGKTCVEADGYVTCRNEQCADLSCSGEQSCAYTSAGTAFCAIGGAGSGSGDCDEGQALVNGSCQNLTCADLDCEVGEVCGFLPNGGAFCSASTCGTLPCDVDEHCEEGPSGASCVATDCSTYDCGAGFECLDFQDGGICADITCVGDVDCDESRFCDAGECVDDLCAASTTRCSSLDLLACAANGASESAVFTCTAADGFSASCNEDIPESAYCECRDDWDCPEYAECDAGQCRGNGQAPTCFLDPEPFSNALPTQEIVWGGAFPGPVVASGSPFEDSVQAVISPIVANLTDDNGDGLINEFDDPEIIFTTFRNSDYTKDGVLRAIHGGGPNKGDDYFATCGATEWKEGDALPATCTYANATLDATASLAVGDIDGDGVPEIVGVQESDGLLVYDNTGSQILYYDMSSLGSNPGPVIANLDQEGFAEVVIGRNVVTFAEDAGGNLVVAEEFVGNKAKGANGQGPVACISDLVGDSRPEIIAGSSVYRFPNKPAGAQSPADCSGLETDPEEIEYCQNDLYLVWDAFDLNGSAIREGFCAVADVLGADQVSAPSPSNPLDGEPEVVVIADGHLQVFNGQDGTLRRDINIDATANSGGAPNIDDFDGDGFPEIGSAFKFDYYLVDLQDPSASCPAWPDTLVDDAAMPAGNSPRTLNGTACTDDTDCGAEGVCNQNINECVCLHNGWRRQTEDDSSRVTGSSVFDFNGDGSAEVVYNDECWFRIYEGITGDVLFKEPSESRTRIEYPIVSDVDNDGNAEIIFTTSTESGFCSQKNQSDGAGGVWRDHYNAGVEVWGDAGDYWVTARRIWNQHGYNVTNVHEGGGIPEQQVDHWRTWEGRSYNVFRSQPRNFGIAPDLVVGGASVAATGSGCNELTNDGEIAVLVVNQGDVRVGAGIDIALEGDFGGGYVPLTSDGATPLTITLDKSLDADGQAIYSVAYDSTVDGEATYPGSIRVTVDSGDVERECDETNNTYELAVASITQGADLRVTIDDVDTGTCPSPTVTATAYNDGGVASGPVKVEFFAGNPEQGGALLGSTTIDDVLPGDSEEVEVALQFPPNASVVVYAVIDRTDIVEECVENNNTAQASAAYECVVVEQ